MIVTRQRLAGIDRLRGLALVLMVLDHALVAGRADGPAGDLVRLTVTRASLPLFCLAAGALVPSQPRWRRLAGVASAGGVATLLGAPIGIGQPDVLILLTLVLAALPFAGRAWPAVLVVAVLQPSTWPVGALIPGWSGYQPGTLVALVILGQLAGRQRVASWGDRLPAFLAFPGKHPVPLYVGHLLVLRGILWAF